MSSGSRVIANDVFQRVQRASGVRSIWFPRAGIPNWARESRSKRCALLA